MEESRTNQVSNRKFKSSVFTTYFSDPKNAAQLYSALDGVPARPEDIRYTTLEGVMFMARKNDMAFTVKNRVLLISEHQSTVNNNMPLRDVIYYGRTMERFIEHFVKPKALYRERQISIPTPEFYVFYNGTDPFPAEKTLKLSDAYLEKTNTPMLELFVKVININIPAGHTILEKCRPLYEYSWFIQKVNEYQQTYNRDMAVKLAIEDCISEGIFKEFAREHGSEAVNMIFTQFNLEDAKQVWYEEAFEDGELSQLIKQIRRRLEKGKTQEAIAEDLDEPLESVERICSAIAQCGPDADNIAIIKYLEY